MLQRLNRSLFTLSSSSLAKRRVSTFVSAIETSVNELPLREAVRFTDKNVKWTSEKLNNHANNHAATLVEVGFQKGDPILLWMPEGREKYVSLLAAAKLGLFVTDLDPAMVSIANIRKILFLVQPRMIVFNPEVGNNRLELLRQSIPEFYHYDDEDGHAFHSKYFPKLQYFLHTGFDLEVGCHNFKRWLVNSPDKSSLLQATSQVTDDLPLYRRATLNLGNIEISNIYTQKEVYEQKLWPWAENVITNTYFEL